MSPLLRASRIAAQLAPLLIVELIPYFRKRPFSCAMTMGELSVSAIIPNFKSDVSGASLAHAPGTRKLAVDPRPAAASWRNLRRVKGPFTRHLSVGTRNARATRASSPSLGGGERRAVLPRATPARPRKLGPPRRPGCGNEKPKSARSAGRLQRQWKKDGEPE